MVLAPSPCRQTDQVLLAVSDEGQDLVLSRRAELTVRIVEDDMGVLLDRDASGASPSTAASTSGTLRYSSAVGAARSISNLVSPTMKNASPGGSNRATNRSPTTSR